MKSNLAQEPSNDNSDFLIGDVVVIDGLIPKLDEVYQVLEVYEHTVSVYIGIGCLTLNKRFVRSASVTEIKANRRLTDVEQSKAEVS